MGRHRKDYEITITNQSTMETPKTIHVSVPTRVVQTEPPCSHCQQNGTSRCNRSEDKFLAEFGFRVKYMKCLSDKCLSATGGEGRGWQYREFEK